MVDPVYYEPAEMLELDNFNNVAYLILATASFLIILTILIGTILRNENEKLLPVVSIAKQFGDFRRSPDGQPQLSVQHFFSVCCWHDNSASSVDRGDRFGGLLRLQR